MMSPKGQCAQLLDQEGSSCTPQAVSTNGGGTTTCQVGLVFSTGTAAACFPGRLKGGGLASPSHGAPPSRPGGQDLLQY